MLVCKNQGCAGFCAEISLDGYRTNKRQAPCFIAKQAKRCKAQPQQVSLEKDKIQNQKAESTSETK